MPSEKLICKGCGKPAANGHRCPGPFAGHEEPEYTLPSGYFPGEQDDVRAVLLLGAKWGYGNLIHRLKSAWAESLENSGISRQAAAQGSGLVCVWCKTDTRTGKKNAKQS